jgi:hypothetical protein
VAVVAFESLTKQRNAAGIQERERERERWR